MSSPKLPGMVVGRWLVPIGILATGAALPDTRIGALVVLVIGFGFLRWRHREVASAWAAGIPVAISLAWGLVPLPASATDGTTCSEPLAPFATARAVDATLALGGFAILYALVGRDPGELGLRRPSRRVGGIAVVGAVLVGPLALLLGPALSEPFFGPLPIDTGEPWAIVPAALFAVSNGVMEEVIYRGVLQAWLARIAGIGPAVVAQAVVFGLAHGASPDFVGSPLPVVALMIAGGVAAGVIAHRTRSLALPIALHVAVDIPLYYGNACLIA